MKGLCEFIEGHYVRSKEELADGRTMELGASYTAVKNIKDYMVANGLWFDHENGCCQHEWIKLHPIDPDNQKHYCINCNNVK